MFSWIGVSKTAVFLKDKNEQRVWASCLMIDFNVAADFLKF